MMDSRLVYSATEHLKLKLVWAPSDNYGWRYCGRSADPDMQLITACVDEHFSDDELYFVPNRRDGRLIKRPELVELVFEHIDAQDLWFWSPDLLRAMHFYKIGVFRFGSVS